MKFKGPDWAWEYIVGNIKLIQDKSRREYMRNLLFAYEDKFLTNPAGLGHHHTQLGGLVMHTAQVLETALKLLKQYRKNMTGITEENVYVVAVLHDLAKCMCYESYEAPIGVILDKPPNFVWNKSFNEEHDIWTLAEATKYGVKLTNEEMIAIMYTHGAWSPLVIGNNFYSRKIKFTKLATIMHCADMLNSQIVKK